MAKKHTKKHGFHQYKPPHFPFEKPSFPLSMGLIKVPKDDWFEIFDHKERAFQFKEKNKLLSRNLEDIFMAHPSAFAASKEVLNLMLEHLPSFRPDLYSRNDNVIELKPHLEFKGDKWATDQEEMHPLDLAARLVQEDLVIMLPQKDHGPHASAGWWLAAGSVAFPSRWSLKEKYGMPMDIIHAPVPFYADQLKSLVDGFFAKMPYNEIYARRNWSLYDNPTLRQDNTEHENGKERKLITPKNAGEKLWLRVERQTLTKLKESGAILFTIRIHLRQLKHVVKFDEVSNKLAKALSALPPKMHTYKQTDIFLDSVLAYLNQFK